jgi:hypothetical protein
VLELLERDLPVPVGVQVVHQLQEVVGGESVVQTLQAVHQVGDLDGPAEREREREREQHREAQYIKSSTVHIEQSSTYYRAEQSSTEQHSTQHGM